jgi:hypothetical protein
VVVVVGLTDCVPEVAVELVQPLGVVAEQLVVFAEVQVSVELCPEEIVVGLAVRDTEGWGATTTESPAVELKLGRILVLVAELAKPLPLVKAMLAVAIVAVVVKCSTRPKAAAKP